MATVEGAAPLMGTGTASAAATALFVHIASFPQAAQCAPLISAALDAVSLAVKRAQLVDAQSRACLWASGDPSGTVSTVLGAEVQCIDRIFAMIKAAAASGNTAGSAIAAVGGAETKRSWLQPPLEAPVHLWPSTIPPPAASVARGGFNTSAAHGPTHARKTQLGSVVELDNSDDHSTGEDSLKEKEIGREESHNQDASEDEELPEAPPRHFMINETECYVPENWKMPKVNTRTTLQRWFLADPDNPKIPPWRYLANSDVRHVPRGRVDLGEVRALVKIMVKELKRQGNWSNSNPTASELDRHYESCRKLLFDSFETSSGHKCKSLSKLDGLSWKSLYQNVVTHKRLLDMGDRSVILPRNIAEKVSEYRAPTADNVIPTTWFQCNIQEGVRRWLVFGRLEPSIPALQHLHARNFPPMGQNKPYLLRYMKLMKLFVEKVKEGGEWRECPTVAQVDDWYNRYGHVVKGEIVSGDKKRRRVTAEDAGEEDNVSV